MIPPLRVRLAHGNGGRHMRELIEGLFVRHLGNPELNVGVDAARLRLAGLMDAGSEALAVTTDGFTVQPLEFPGGDIGSLAVNGTVNDLAVSGAEPRFLTLNAFIEEGLPLDRLDRLMASLAAAARDSGVRVVAGDTKVLPRGQGSGLYLATTGIGVFGARRLSSDGIRPGDRLLISGPIGDHGTAVLLAREEFGLHGEMRSDCASVLPLTRAILDLPGLRFMRDPTRGGLATVAQELFRATGLPVRLFEADIPVRDTVRGVCEILGYDPLYLACEGRVLAVVSAADADLALQRWRLLPQGHDAADIGEIGGDGKAVILETGLGGERALDELQDDPLPRIC